jgi:hypothetical protein
MGSGDPTAAKSITLALDWLNKLLQRASATQRSVYDGSETTKG